MRIAFLLIGLTSPLSPSRRRIFYGGFWHRQVRDMPWQISRREVEELKRVLEGVRSETSAYLFRAYRGAFVALDPRLAETDDCFVSRSRCSGRHAQTGLSKCDHRNAQCGKARARALRVFAKSACRSWRRCGQDRHRAHGNSTRGISVPRASSRKMASGGSCKPAA